MKTERLGLLDRFETWSKGNNINTKAQNGNDRKKETKKNRQRG